MRLLTLLVALAAALLAQPDLPSSLSAEIERIRVSSADTPAAERTAPAARLERARTALAAGRPLLALYLLESPWENARGWTFAKNSSRLALCILVYGAAARCCGVARDASGLQRGGICDRDVSVHATKDCGMIACHFVEILARRRNLLGPLRVIPSATENPFARSGRPGAIGDSLHHLFA